jgi:hypothetical protein
VHVLETDRLRHLTPNDAAFIVELVNEPASTHFIGGRGIRPPDEARA